MSLPTTSAPRSIQSRRASRPSCPYRRALPGNQLDAYALEHRLLYERIETAALIPHMLEAFLVVPPLSCRESISAEIQETEFDRWLGRR
jgi:hypothetical protein